jgi:phospholipase C
VTKLEEFYSSFLTNVFGVLNPIKKIIIKTECQVHKYINMHALTILKNDLFYDQYDFFRAYIKNLNCGSVWADQDFKSSNHFYNPYKRNGLYGQKNALELAIDYHTKALRLWRDGYLEESLFYFGAALHMIQDMTVPQHVNIRLLDDHRQFENYVKRTYDNIKAFRAYHGAYLLSSIENYMKFNARISLKVYKRYQSIPNNEERYCLITKCTLPLAERTTAGAMVLFYKQIKQRYGITVIKASMSVKKAAN